MAYLNSNSIVAPGVNTPPGTRAELTHKDAAIELGVKGLSIGPLCHPNEQGQCGCGKAHTGHSVGKAPTTAHGVKDFTNSIRPIFEWWQRDPLANIGIGLDASGLILVAPDSPEWHQTFLDRGLPDTATAVSGGGEGHLHYFYRAPVGIPLVHINRPDEFDIQSQGYAVAVGSLHQSGRTYRWLNNFPWKDVEDLPYAPPWVLEQLQAKWEAQEALPAVPDDFKEVELRTGLIKGTLEDWWNGTVSALHADGTVDRSLTLWNIGLLLARQGVTFEEIVSALRDRDIALDFQKFHDRRDGGHTEYLRIAQKVLAGVQSHGLPTDTPMEWDQVVDAVAYDVASEPFYMERADSPRRRFPLHTDRGAIRHIRQRLNPIWMETQQKIGHQGVHDRAVKCGDLPARGCDDCSTSFSDGKQYRYNCRARLHPLCMGTQARKPLWAMQEALETESNLEILIANLGVYDVGEDPFLWADKIRDISKQAHSWVRRLTSHKDCPESISTSFTAFRYDLHQRYLNLDLVILAPVVPDTATTLAASFGEATERAVTFKTVRVKSAEEAIGVYGNLLSSAVIYDDTAGCQAFLQGLKDVHMVQGRGRFRTKRATKPQTDGLTNISNIVPSVDILEINANQAKPGGGKPLTRCPECGSSHTRYKGRIAGDWRKVKGPTGIWYWRLENVVEEGPDG